MTLNDVKPQQAARKQTEPVKVPLEEYPDLVKSLFSPRLNLRSQQIEISGKEISEEEFESLHIYAAQTHGLKFRKSDLQAQVRANARQASYDPVQQYLSGLGCEGGPCLTDEEWDQIAVLALGLEDSWSRLVVQKWLISAIARAMDPGCKVDYCLILHGGQGLTKSSFFNAIGGDFFSDSMDNLENKKDDLLILHRNWICEWSEADQVFVGANKAERIKRFVSSREDTFRAPYGRTTQCFPRRSILCGTTNRDDWANDPTGNRRFPVLSPPVCNIAWIEENRERILSRAVVAWRSGQQWWFTKEEEARITRETAEYAATNDEVEMVWEFLKRVKGEWWSTRDLMLKALGREAGTIKQSEVSQLTRALNVLTHRGCLKDRRNYQGRTGQSPSRIKANCWMVPESLECNESKNPKI